MKTEEICGMSIDRLYDKQITRLNLELVKVTYTKDDEGYYAIQFENWDKKGKVKKFFILHINEAIELKGVIDSLVYDATLDKVERLKESLVK